MARVSTVSIEREEQGKLIDSLAKKHRNAFRKELKRVVFEAMKSYRIVGRIPSEIFIDHTERLKKILENATTDSGKKAGKRQFRLLRRGNKKSIEIKQEENEDTEFDFLLGLFALNYALSNSSEISSTTERRTRAAIDQAGAEGLNRDDTTDFVENKVGKKQSRIRSGIIALATVASAFNFGTSESSAVYGKANDLKVDKIWVTRHDELVRESHREANGQKVDLKDTFIVGGEELRFPADPDGSPGNVINCRCVMRYETEEI
jgi:hypothetical protein